MNKNIYLVASYNNTVPGKIIKLRAAMKFWNRYPGDTYSHISLSRDSKLGNMLSFARKEVDNPFNSGLIKEDIRKDMFALNKENSKIAVMKLQVTSKEFENITKNMNEYWANKDKYKFNFAGLTTMLLYGKGVAPKDRFFCSQWVDTVLTKSGIDIFDGKKPEDVRPFDFYGTLKDNIIYEGPTTKYPEYDFNSGAMSDKSYNADLYSGKCTMDTSIKVFQYKR